MILWFLRADHGRVWDAVRVGALGSSLTRRRGIAPACGSAASVGTESRPDSRLSTSSDSHDLQKRPLTCNCAAIGWCLVCRPGTRTEGNSLKKIIVAVLATLALTLSVSTGAQAASASWVAGGGNDVQNGNLSSSLYMSSSAVTKAKVTYNKRRDPGSR